MRFILLFLLSFSAHAMDVDVAIGSTKFQSSPNGIWWQQGFDNTRDLQSVSYSIGVSDYAWPSIRWRVAYSRLGHVQTSGIGTTDEDYNGTDGCIANPCVQQALYTTDSSVRGFAFTLAPEKQFGAFKVFVEGGAFVYLMKFRAQMAPCRTCAVTWDNEYREGWNFAPQLGAGIEYKKTQFVLIYRKIDAPTKDPNAIVNVGSDTLTAEMRKLF